MRKIRVKRYVRSDGIAVKSHSRKIELKRQYINTSKQALLDEVDRLDNLFDADVISMEEYKKKVAPVSDALFSRGITLHRQSGTSKSALLGRLDQIEGEMVVIIDPVGNMVSHTRFQVEGFINRGRDIDIPLGLQDKLRG